MKRYNKLYAAGKSADGAIRNIPVNIAVADIFGAANAGLGLVAEQAGLSVVRLLLDGERQRMLEAGHGYRHGEQRGYVYLGGRKVNTPSLRMRDHKDREIPLRAYKALQGRDALSRRALSDMLRGVSARDYRGGVEGFMRGYGISKSSVSRNFIVAAQDKLRELMERRIDAIGPVALFLDGKGFGECLLVVAIGVDREGGKHVLGLWQGATENAAVCEALLNDLVRRGLDPRKRYLFITDGAKALRKAIGKVFGGRALTQRCQEHKKRNVLEHLPDKLQPEYRRKLNAAYGMAGYEDAKSALCDCARELERLNPSAARSLEEGLEETLTLHRLGLPALLRESLRTTNCIESAFSQVGGRTGRVKRWRDGAQTQRWAASALLFVEGRWRKIRGWRLLDRLEAALEGDKNQIEQEAEKSL